MQIYHTHVVQQVFRRPKRVFPRLTWAAHVQPRHRIEIGYIDEAKRRQPSEVPETAHVSQTAHKQIQGSRQVTLTDESILVEAVRVAYFAQTDISAATLTGIGTHNQLGGRGGESGRVCGRGGWRRRREGGTRSLRGVSARDSHRQHDQI